MFARDLLRTAMDVLFLLRMLRVTRWVIHATVFAILVILEPFARAVLGGLAIISMITSLFFVCFTSLPGFPFWGMLAVSVGSLHLLVAYYTLIRLAAPLRRRA
jgi:hypothetical protein